MPRLTKGQMAAGIRLRLDLSTSSADARIAVLKDLQSAGCLKANEAAKLRSFQQLAAWEDPERGITPLSPKTLRKHLDARYAGGSAGFRQDVAHMLGRDSVSPAATSGESQKQRVERFSADAAMEMTTRYLDLLERMKRLSVASEAAEVELLRHLRRYSEGGATLRVVKSES